MLKTFRYRLYPNKSQSAKIGKTISLCQYLYNCALEHRIKAYKKGGKINYYDQANELSGIKETLPEYNEVYSQSIQDVLKRLNKAYQGFFRRLKQGEKPGFPKFQSKHRYNSFTYPQSGFKIQGNRLQLSKIGNVKIKLHREIKGEIKTCTIVRKNNHYYACFSCEAVPEPVKLTGKAAGIDMGIKDFCITSDEGIHPNPRYYRQTEKS